jgi:hypothetical protein
MAAVIGLRSNVTWRLKQHCQRGTSDAPSASRRYAVVLGLVALYSAGIAACSPEPAWAASASCADPQPSSRRPIIDGHTVQPKASEFAAPCGSPDVRSEQADEVDRLYVEIMQRALHGPVKDDGLVLQR